ncbi:MAG: metallophosphoesterase [Chlamydiota bacterium]
MRIAQISDFHYTHITWNPFRLFSKRILGNLNWIFSRESEFSVAQLDSLPALFTKLGVDLVLLGGDFSTTSLLQEFESASKFVKQIKQPWIAVPGNHDHYTGAAYRDKRFYRYFANLRKKISHPVDFFTLKDHGVEAHRIGPNWWVIALDTAHATHLFSSAGLLSEKTERYLEEIIQLLPPNDFILMLNHYPFFQNDETRRNLERGKVLQSFLKKHPRIRLYLHGHTHRRTVANLQPNDLPIVLDSGSSAETKKGSWNLIDLTDEGCSIGLYAWKNGWVNTRTEEFSWTRK